MIADARSLRGRTLFITGGSRGIGLAIALRAAEDGANVVIAAKTAEPHLKLPGTIHTAAAEIERAGGRALPLVLDVRDADAVAATVEAAAAHFGGIDVCINNASAIDLARSEDVTAKRFDLLQQVNMRGTFLVSRACVPHLRRAPNPHVLTLSPPLTLRPEWFASHLPYTISKYGMSMVTLGMAEEFRAEGIAFNSLWPRTTIATAAVEFALGGPKMLRRSRLPSVMADAAHVLLCRDARTTTGKFLLDEDVLRDAGIADFEQYRAAPGEPLLEDLFTNAIASRREGKTITSIDTFPILAQDSSKPGRDDGCDADS